MDSKLSFHSINAHLHCQVRSIGCYRLQMGCQLHYHAADSVLTSGCFSISHRIWIKIFIMLAILGICIKIQKLSTGKRSMFIHISGWHICDFGWMSCLIVTGWNGWCFGWMWCRFWCRLSESLWGRCTHAFASPTCVGILRYAILGRKAAVRLIFPNHSLVSFHPSLHMFMPRKLNSPLLLFSHFVPRYLDQELRFLYCGEHEPPFGHFGQIQSQVHVRWFELYPTSLPCHSCRHVDNLLGNYLLHLHIRFGHYLNHIHFCTILDHG